MTKLLESIARSLSGFFKGSANLCMHRTAIATPLRFIVGALLSLAFRSEATGCTVFDCKEKTTGRIIEDDLKWKLLLMRMNNTI